MQKKIIKRYTNRSKYIEYKISDMPYSNFVEEKGICAIFKKTK